MQMKYRKYKRLLKEEIKSLKSTLPALKKESKRHEKLNSKDNFSKDILTTLLNDKEEKILKLEQFLEDHSDLDDDQIINTEFTGL